MKKYFSLLLLAMFFMSCSKDSPTSATEDPNGYSNYQLYLDGIKVVSDCDESADGEFFYTIAVLDYKDSILATAILDKDYKKKAKNGEYIDINRTLNLRLLNSQSFKIVGKIYEYNLIFDNEEIPFNVNYVYPYNSTNMVASNKLDGKDGYSAIVLKPKTGCELVMYFTMTKQ